MNDNIVRARFDYPKSIMDPLVEICLGEKPDDDVRKDLVNDAVFVYYHFCNILNGKKKVIAAVNMFRNGNTPVIESLDYLQPFRQDFKDSEENLPLEYTARRPLFNALIKVSYPKRELGDLTAIGLTEREMLKDAMENSLASLYWCMLNVSNGRRIGALDYKDRVPDIKGYFYEMDLQELFPRYDELKAFSLDEKDFIVNASIEDVADRLLDTRDLLIKAVKNEESESVLKKLSGEIKDYTMRLKQGPEVIFKEAGYKQ